jgi:predicted HAD superfamily Cof-like phosphohydrolase
MNYENADTNNLARAIIPGSHLETTYEFHRAFGIPIASRPSLPHAEFRWYLLKSIDSVLYALESLAQTAREDAAALDDSAPSKHRLLRLSLLAEEVAEYFDAEADCRFTGIADALGDIGVICEGTALVYGIPLDAVRREIHRSNMSKLGADGAPIFREDGKVLKGPNYVEPNLGGLLDEARDRCVPVPEGIVQRLQGFWLTSWIWRPRRDTNNTGKVDLVPFWRGR